MRVLVGPNNFGLEQVIPALAAKYPDVQFAFCPDRANLAAEIADADVFFGWPNRAEFLAAKKLRWVQSPSSGVDIFLSIPELRDGDVLLTSARGTHGACLAEHALALIFAFTRGIKGSVLAQQQRQWAIRDLRPRVVELTGSTLGIIGFGVVGRALAKRAQVFDTRILAVDMLPGEKPAYVERLEGLEGLEALLRESDYIVVTVPRTPLTIGMIGAAQLALVKPTALLIGISRGGIINEAALVEALRAGRLAGAGLDGVDHEPLPADSPLWGLENVLITPPLAGGSQFEGQYIREIFAETVGRFLRGELPLRNQVDKQRGF